MQQHQSWFSYNIVRPYPFRWFSWVALLGGIAAAILFSVLNLAATGYNLQTIYTTDPNATLHEDYWFTKAPWSWTAKMRSSCQAQNIPVGYEFFTRNLGFSYTLESVSGYEEGSNTITSYPSLPYLNQNLDNCTIASVEIDLSKRDQTQNGYSAWWSWPGTGKVTATCTVSTGGGIYNATFSTECGSAQHHYDYVIQANATHLSSMWWATRLLNMYWNGLLTGVAQSLYPSDDGNWTTTPIWMTYSMTLTPNRTEDITKYNFFGLEYYIIAANADLFNFVQYPLSTMYDNHDTLPFSVALTQGLGWSKVAHSAILTDLGQKQGQNLLTNETLLQWALNHPTDTFRNDPDNVLNCSTKTCNYYWDFWAGIAPPSVLKAEDKDYVVANESYNAFKDSMGPLGTFDTTIFSQYACSVPVRKDGGTLFLSILVADLVFLNAAWVLLQWVATAIVARGMEVARQMR